MADQQCEACRWYRVFDDGDTDCDQDRATYGGCPIKQPCPDYERMDTRLDPTVEFGPQMDGER